MDSALVPQQVVSEVRLKPRQDPYIRSMPNYQPSTKREPPKTKSELREMIAEAVRNTQGSAAPKREHSLESSPKKIGA